jgi:hypothetical protein
MRQAFGRLGRGVRIGAHVYLRFGATGQKTGA